MTIQQAVDLFDATRCNTVDEQTKRGWLSVLDGQIHQDVILTHVHTQAQAEFTGYDAQSPADTVLLITAPHDAELYPLYMELRLARENGETDRYNQAATLFNQALLCYQDRYNRAHLPLHGGTRFLF